MAAQAPLLPGTRAKAGGAVRAKAGGTASTALVPAAAASDLVPAVQRLQRTLQQLAPAVHRASRGGRASSVHTTDVTVSLKAIKDMRRAVKGVCKSADNMLELLAGMSFAFTACLGPLNTYVGKIDTLLAEAGELLHGAQTGSLAASLGLSGHLQTSCAGRLAYIEASSCLLISRPGVDEE